MDIREIYHHFGLPLMLALVLSGCKLLVKGEAPSLDDANDTGLDMIFVSLGAISVIKTTAWTGEMFLSVFAGNMLLALVLLTIRGARIRKNTTLVPPLPEVPWWLGSVELLLGISSMVWTVNPPS